jgi:hypothetical protein
MPLPTLPSVPRLGLGALVAGVAVLCGGDVQAQIATDRPDFVESSAVVGAGAVQVEASVAYGRTGVGSEKQASLTTPTLLRVGVSSSVELRMETDGWVRDDSALDFAMDDGMADLAVGLKWHTSDESGGRPATALLLHADLPSGSRPHRGDGVRPSARVVAEWTLPRGFAVGVMPGVALARSGDESYAAGSLGVVVGKELTGSLRTFGELALESIASERRGGTMGVVNAGLALLLSPAAQLDAGLSWGLNGRSPDFQWTAGLSVLRPGS